MCSAARGFLLVLPSDPSRGFVVLTPCQEKGTINKQLPCILSSHPFRTFGWATLRGQWVVALGTGCPCVLEPVLVSVRVRRWSRTVWKDLEQGEGRAATAAQVSGWEMPDRSSWEEEETFLSHGSGSGSPVWANPPSQQLWGLQQWPSTKWKLMLRRACNSYKGDKGSFIMVTL